MILRPERMSSTEVRDLKTYSSQLLKQIESKDAKIDSLISELHHSRSNILSLQGELRSMRTISEKLKELNAVLQTEINQGKSEISALRSEVKGLQDVRLDVKRIEVLKSNINKLQDEILKKEDDAKDNAVKIEFLERELEVCHRAISIQNRYESNNGLTLQNSREVLRSTYFELGKKQADLHTLSLSFADSNRLLEAAKSELAASHEKNEQLKSENDKLSSNLKFATQQSIDCTNQIESLHEKILSQRDLSTHLKGQVDDLSARLSEARQQWQEEVAQRDSKIAETAAALQAQEDAAQDTASQLASLQKSLAYMDNVNKLNEQKWQQQVRQLQAENQQLLRTSQTLDSVRSENDILQRNIMDVLREKDEAFREVSSLRDELTKLLSQLQDKQGDFTQTQQRLTASTAEKAEAVAALQQTMKVVRELSARLQKEKKGRDAAETQLSSLTLTLQQHQQSKESVSVVILDALQRERQKNKELEKKIRTLPLDIRLQAGLGLLLDSSTSAVRSSSDKATVFSGHSNSKAGIDSLEVTAVSVTEGSTSQQTVVGPHSTHTYIHSKSDAMSSSYASSPLRNVSAYAAPFSSSHATSPSTKRTSPNPAYSPTIPSNPNLVKISPPVQSEPTNPNPSMVLESFPEVGNISREERLDDQVRSPVGFSDNVWVGEEALLDLTALASVDLTGYRQAEQSSSLSHRSLSSHLKMQNILSSTSSSVSLHGSESLTALSNALSTTSSTTGGDGEEKSGTRLDKVVHGPRESNGSGASSSSIMDELTRLRDELFRIESSGPNLSLSGPPSRNSSDC